MQSIDRRGVLKILGAAGLAAAGVAGASKLNAGENADIRANILIIGGGLGGISLAAKLRRDMPNAELTVLDKDEYFYYQPGFTLIAAGHYLPEDITYEKSNLIPDGVKWIKQNAASIDPGANSVKLEDGSNLNYDYLVIASGAEYEFESVKGLSADDIGSDNVTSIYTIPGAVAMSGIMKKVGKEGGKIVFSDNKTPMKCSGANKKVTLLTEDMARNLGNRDKLDISIYSGARTIFSAPIYAKMIEGMLEERDVKYFTSHQLVEVDKSANIAVFEHAMPYRENGENKLAKELVEVKFDYLHLVPRMKASKIYADAGLSVEKGDVAGNWISLTRETLQHSKFKNIFAIGDVCGFAAGKTGASIRKMYSVLAQNLADVIKGREPSARYGGYTACPLLTKFGKAVMVEFNWTGKPEPTIACMGATRESYLNWAMKLYMMKPMVMQGMIRGLA